MEKTIIFCEILSVFSKTMPIDTVYFGCFDERYLPGGSGQVIFNEDDMTLGPIMTISGCQQYCITQGSDVYGLKNRNTCYCLAIINNDLQHLLTLAKTDTACLNPCIGSSNDTLCGNVTSVAIYLGSTELIAEFSAVFSSGKAELPTTSMSQIAENTFVSDIQLNYETSTASSTTTETSDQTQLPSTINLATDRNITALKPTTSFLTSNTPTVNSYKGTDSQVSTNMTTSTSEALCGCNCSSNTNVLTKFTFDEKLTNLIKFLLIDRKTTSAYRNSKHSAHDPRLSSCAIGWIGILVLCLPITLIVFVDISNFKQRKKKYMFQDKKNEN